MLEYCTIVGISGKKRAGKGTTADYLTEHYGFIQIAFADPIYDGLQAMFGINFRAPEWQNDKDRIVAGTGKSLRYLMQTLGTEWGQHMVDRLVWVYRAEMRMREMLAVTTHSMGWVPRFVLTDLREVHEAEWLARFGPILRVSNPRTFVPDNHTSEAGIPEEMISFDLLNTEDKPYLYKQIDAVMGILDIGRQHDV